MLPRKVHEQRKPWAVLQSKCSNVWGPWPLLSLWVSSHLLDHWCLCLLLCKGSAPVHSPLPWVPPARAQSQVGIAACKPNYHSKCIPQQSGWNSKEKSVSLHLCSLRRKWTFCAGKFLCEGIFEESISS